MTKKEEEKTFEENITSLEAIVKSCNDKLTSAEENINKILKENGKLEDFQIEE